MSHKEQVDWCLCVKDMYPQYFKNVKALDVGSQDINGNNKVFFENSDYTGLDIGPGKNVDIVCPIHEFETLEKYDTIISTEMLEHDKFYEKSLLKMLDLLKPNGLLVLTAGGHNREEHGTSRSSGFASPHTLDYYGNIYIGQLSLILKPEINFKRVMIDYITPINDIRFAGIKR